MKYLEPVRAKFDKPITGVPLVIRSARRFAKRSAAKKHHSTQRARRLTSKSSGVPNIKVAYWLTNNVDFDQCILGFYKPDDGQAGWIHVSYNEKGSNRKQILTFDGRRYDYGLPEMKWESGQVAE